MGSSRNFSAGPGALPAAVLAQAQQAVLELPGSGISILGLSHRSQQFQNILGETEERLRQLLGVSSNYRVLFLQGGGTLQFSMVPLAMLPPGGVADYLVSGYWSAQAADVARRHGGVRIAWDGAPHGFSRLPRADEPVGSADAAYLHYVSNETVEGLQFRWLPRTTVPLVCDASSDFLSKPLEVQPFSLIYAHAQKNLGPAGVTIVLVRDEVLDGIPPGLPPILDYRAHANAGSLLHTPTVFSIYVVLLSLRWLANEMGGLSQMGKLNAEKARLVRGALTTGRPFFVQSVESDFASDMNVTFRCPSEALDALLVASAEQAGFVGIQGHRSRGGLRISLYNGVSLEDARAIADFLVDFAEEHENERPRKEL
jgi:phosphoserine aminotransferase